MRYARQRDAVLGEPRSPYFLVAKHGGRLWGPTVRVAFYQLSRQIGLRGVSDRCGPRLHDFRQNAESGKMPNHAGRLPAMPGNTGTARYFRARAFGIVSRALRVAL